MITAAIVGAAVVSAAVVSIAPHLPQQRQRGLLVRGSSLLPRQHVVECAVDLLRVRVGVRVRIGVRVGVGVRTRVRVRVRVRVRWARGRPRLGSMPSRATATAHCCLPTCSRPPDG